MTHRRLGLGHYTQTPFSLRTHSQRPEDLSGPRARPWAHDSYVLKGAELNLCMPDKPGE